LRKIFNQKIILASGSPRRIEILRDFGFQVVADAPNVVEMTHGKPPNELVEFNADLKVKSLLAKYDKQLILSADTVCALDGEILGKPKDATQARQMLEKLSGRSHEVFTAIFAFDQKQNKAARRTTVTKVFFKQLQSSEIDFLLENENCLDKAGAYGIQSYASLFIERIEGDYFNVVGLSPFALREVFAELTNTT
jgi:septum formation protein